MYKLDYVDNFLDRFSIVKTKSFTMKNIPKAFYILTIAEKH